MPNDGFIPSHLDINAPLGRTMAQIRAEAARKRSEQREARKAKAAERQKAREAKAEQTRLAKLAKSLRIQIAAATDPRNGKMPRARTVYEPRMLAKDTVPRHLARERKTDDPKWAFFNHIVDEATLDREDVIIARLDGKADDDTEALATVEPLSLKDRVALGLADDAEVIAWMALELGESIEFILEEIVPSTLDAFEDVAGLVGEHRAKILATPPRKHRPREDKNCKSFKRSRVLAPANADGHRKLNAHRQSMRELETDGYRFAIRAHDVATWSANDRGLWMRSKPGISWKYFRRTQYRS